LNPDAWAELAGHIAGTAASGLVGALIGSLLLAPGLFAAVASVGLSKRGELRGAPWGKGVAGLAGAGLSCLAVEFASDELEHWFQRVVIGLAFLILALGLLALPVAWWRGRSRSRPRPQVATVWKPPTTARARRPPRATGLVVTAVLVLASTVPAALLKYRVFPEHLAWSTAEACALAVVAAPFAWLVGRYGFDRRRGSGLVVLASTVAVSGWLSLAGRWQLTHQAAAAMQEMAALMRTLRRNQSIEVRPEDRWRYGPYAPMVRGMSRFYDTVRASTGSMDELEPVLTATGFANAAELRRTRARLDAFKKKANDVDSEVSAAAGRLLFDLDHADVPRAMRQKMLEGVKSGLGESPMRVTAGLTPMIGALEELVAFMESRRGRYHDVDGRLAFEIDADAARFDRLLDGVLSLQKQTAADYAAKKEHLNDGTAAFDEWAQDPFNRKPADRR
jgi:hypothetical protein